ncbi:group II trans-sialidase superfamily [Trypanosoma conorhini]|uniref:Group II trans-sialidase superfamily n=1 Tax=Trypanosoma conorhini TaxID=83891 RepID=A0A422MQP6_9TRYP|nr:group II trans-sialidase superfamily [Trypanosoma conorhini]RNE95568.1 group II trans-sialidase superfamily [Trypanosoma conorhini]
MWDYGNVYGFVNYAFTLVATVLIHQAPKGSAPLLFAGREDDDSIKFVGLAYTAEMKWETVFNGTAAAPNGSWEPGKHYQVALVLQGNKGSVYVDGELVGSSEALPTLEARNYEISHFYFGAGEGGRVAVTDVLLYNRPLSATEPKLENDTSDSGSDDSSEADSSMRADVSRVLLLLLLLGLWGFAALS